MVTARVTIKSHPRMLVPVAVMAALVVAALVVAALVQVVVGLLALVPLGYLCFRIVRITRKHLASYVATDEAGITVCEFGEETTSYAWPEVTFAGRARTHDGRELAYAYVERDDRLLTISPEFENYRPLHDDLRRHVAPHDLALEQGESLAERLRGQLPERELPEQAESDR